MKTILFADDQKNIREFCGAVFLEEGYRLLLARDGLEALEIFTAERPDLAILDISMPRLDGLETLERIHCLSPCTPVVLFTASDEDCLHDVRARLATACIEKTEDLADLKRVVANVLRGQHWQLVGESKRIRLTPTLTTGSEKSNTRP
jgi:CheY-like chemotaxis protein